MIPKFRIACNHATFAIDFHFFLQLNGSKVGLLCFILRFQLLPFSRMLIIMVMMSDRSNPFFVTLD